MTASMSDFRRVADDVRNWGRWGDADELGTLNFITAENVAEAAGLVKQGKVPATRAAVRAYFRETRTAYVDGELRTRIARRHDDPDAAF